MQLTQPSAIVTLGSTGVIVATRHLGITVILLRPMRFCEEEAVFVQTSPLLSVTLTVKLSPRVLAGTTKK